MSLNLSVCTKSCSTLALNTASTVDTWSLPFPTSLKESGFAFFISAIAATTASNLSGFNILHQNASSVGSIILES